VFKARAGARGSYRVSQIQGLHAYTSRENTYLNQWRETGSPVVCWLQTLMAPEDDTNDLLLVDFPVFCLGFSQFSSKKKLSENLIGIKFSLIIKHRTTIVL
jgi:hypothetical protein